MTTWNDTTTISTGWADDNTQTQGIINFNVSGIKFNEVGVKFNGLVDYDYRHFLYTATSKPETGWADA
jgi:hypothetical protein